LLLPLVTIIRLSPTLQSNPVYLIKTQAQIVFYLW